MKITEVIVRKIFEESSLKAVATIIIDDVFAVHDIKVVESFGRRFIVMPAKKISFDVFKDIAHPTNLETRHMIEDCVYQAYDMFKDIGHGRLRFDEDESV